jgi:hypothetical protein
VNDYLVDRHASARRIRRNIDIATVPIFAVLICAFLVGIISLSRADETLTPPKLVIPPPPKQTQVPSAYLPANLLRPLVATSIAAASNGSATSKTAFAQISLCTTMPMPPEPGAIFYVNGQFDPVLAGGAVAGQRIDAIGSGYVRFADGTTLLATACPGAQSQGDLGPMTPMQASSPIVPGPQEQPTTPYAGGLPTYGQVYGQPTSGGSGSNAYDQIYGQPASGTSANNPYDQVYGQTPPTPMPYLVHPGGAGQPPSSLPPE